MDIIFKNFIMISKKFDLHRLLLNFTDKLNLKRSDQYVALLNVSV